MVILVPGCEGLTNAGSASHYGEAARWLAEQGFLAILVDYVGAQGVPSACGGEIPLATLAHAIRLAMTDAAGLADGDANALSLLGWAWGGAGVLAAIEDPALARRVRSAIAYYPPCRALARWRSSVPTLLLIGEADPVTPSADCISLLERAASPASVLLARYQNALHAFDMRALEPADEHDMPRRYAFDEAARNAAWHDLTTFLTAR
jgi:dienelactone hydrolase